MKKAKKSHKHTLYFMSRDVALVQIFDFFQKKDKKEFRLRDLA
jgi:hypothetical protein